MSLSDLGELGLVSLFREILAYRRNGPTGSPVELVKGIGDDCAVVRFGDGPTLLLSSDMMVEGTHFVFEAIGPRRLGRKAISSSLSDIAAMGGTPVCALVSVGLPRSMPVESVRVLYEGLRERAGEFGLVIVGGDTVSCGMITIDVSVVGYAPGGRFIGRSGASPGDLVMVTGDLGDSSAGLALLTSGRKLRDGAETEYPGWAMRLLDAHLDPTPRLKEAEVLAKLGGVTSMIDVSDGLSTDANHIARESNVGIHIRADKIPLSNEAKLLASLMKVDPLDWALAGGEDYQLLFTVSPPEAESLSSAISRVTGTKVTQIGDVVDSEAGVWIQKPDGEVMRLTPRGYEHFRR